MSNYLVKPVAGLWMVWEELAKHAKIRFIPDQYAMGQVLIPRSDLPEEKEQVIYMDHGGCGVSSVGWLLSRPRMDDTYVPLHPIVIMAMAMGMQWDWEKDGRVSQHMMYEMAMSPFLLSHPDGRNFIFLLKRNKQGLYGEFQDLSKSEGLPRCMHIWGYPGDKGLEKDFVFHPEADGSYGVHVTCKL